MDILQTLRMALKSILSNKVRTSLTMLGVIIGVATFITLVSLGQGTQKTITDKIESMGTNLITISITGRNSNRNVTYEQVKKLASENSNEIKAVAPSITGSVTLKYSNNSWDTSLIGSTPEYESVKNVTVQSGSFIEQSDVDSKKRVVLLGTAVVKNLFGLGYNPVGEKIKINGQIFKVTGVLEEKAEAENYSTDDRIIIPITVAQRFLSSKIRTFYVQAASSDMVNSAMLKIESFMLDIFNDEDSYRVQNQAEMLSQVSSVTGTLTLFLGFIAGISLLIGGIGIMNIMLVSVTERTREIGIRKAIGAKRRYILSQFLIESMMISCIGGVIGILLGMLAAFVVSKISSLTPAVTLTSVITSFTVSAAIGIFFGMYPANKASKLNPIEALRFE
ncbi:MAG: ABC transporter permease [Deltaproteobacteria bacterium]